ncbi:MAG: twin-arginine translocase subunit TatC [bacterium]|nr:twin-arginine translocase subunit TatC [bacterium]
MLQEFKNFIKNILFWCGVMAGLSLLFFLPLFAGRSPSVLVFEALKRDFLPPGVELVVTNPLTAFLAQVTVSLALAFIFSFPFMLWRAMRYLSPALFDKEKRAVAWVLIPSSALFFAGCAFAYLFIIPSTFALLYPFAASLGAIPFFQVGEFVQLIFAILLATGVLFLLPVGMALLSFLGLIEPGFWRRNWRYSLMLFLIFSAIITPDGTGITMIMLSVPLITLYGIGMFSAVRIEGRDIKK